MSFSTGNDYVAIDTNVFGHLIDKEINKDKHINAVLDKLRERKTSLLVDKNEVIVNEYKHHLQQEEFLAKYENTDEAYLIGYWLYLAPNKKVAVDCNDELARGIKQIIPESDEKPDRVFVYVALREESPLISNDKKHIVNRRNKLKNLSPNCCIRTSQEAYEEVESLSTNKGD